MPRRRLTGIAALSAAALATASTALPGIAADDCVDDECLPNATSAEGASLDFLKQMLESQGLPPETIDQTLALYEQIGLFESDGDLFWKVEEGEAAPKPLIGETEKNDGAGSGSGLREMIAAFGGEGIPEETLALIEEMYAQGNFLSPGQDLNDLFAEGDVFNKLTDLAFPKVEDAAFPKVEDAFLDDALGEAFLKLEGIDGETLESMLLQFLDPEDVDPAMIKMILDQLPEE
jgi:hypothetical protein